MVRGYALDRTSAGVRSGYVAAKRRLIAAPSELPKSAARLEPTASITALTSSMRVSSVGAPLTRSDMPVPRLSKRMSRQKEASRSRVGANEGIVQTSSTCVTNGGMKTRSKGPSPRTWYAMLTSPLRAYFVSTSTTIVSRPLGLACTEICHSRAVDHFPRFVARPEVSEEAVALLVRELSVEHLAIRRRIRVRRAVQEPMERRRLVPRQDAELDSRLEQHVGARESGVVCEFEQVALVEVEHCRRVAGQRVEAVAKPSRERPHLAHLDPAEDAVRLRVAEAVDRLEHREPAAGTEHPEELRERAGLLVDVDNHRARRDDVDRPVGDRAQVLRGGEHELAARVAVRQLARDVEQVLRNIAEDHTAGAAFQRAEGDQPVAAAHVEERLTLPQLRTVEHAVAHLLQPGENPGGRALVAAEAAVEDPLGPAVACHQVGVSRCRRSRSSRSSRPTPAACVRSTG